MVFTKSIINVGSCKHHQNNRVCRAAGQMKQILIPEIACARGNNYFGDRRIGPRLSRITLTNTGALDIKPCTKQLFWVNFRHLRFFLISKKSRKTTSHCDSDNAYLDNFVVSFKCLNRWKIAVNTSLRVSAHTCVRDQSYSNLWFQNIIFSFRSM